MNKRGVGTSYEDLAADFLQAQGYVILERNFYTHFGELDIIAKDGESIVFVEVKYRSGVFMGNPLEAVTKTKRQRIIKSAEYYLYCRHWLDKSCRFDVIGILDREITHIKSAFFSGFD